MSQVHQVTLQRADEIPPGKRPTVSLSLTVKPDTSTAAVTKLLDDVAPHVDEMVVVLVDARQEERDLIERRLLAADKPGSIIDVDPVLYPHLYFLDVPETYAVGRPLRDEVYKVPCTGKQIVADWSAVRNLGWQLCNSDWKLALDGTDVLDKLEYLASVCSSMGEQGADLGFGKYVSNRWLVGCGCLRTSVLAARLARNGTTTMWVGVAKEILEGGSRTAILDGSLSVVQTPGPVVDCIKKELSDFKALYACTRRAGWDMVPPSYLIHMARTAFAVANVPLLTKAAIETYLSVSLYPEERAWACAVQGEVLEAEGKYSEAAAWYVRSTAEHPGSKSFYRLCRARYMEGKWHDSLTAYEEGLENDYFVHRVDDGIEDRNNTLVFVVDALLKLGYKDEARKKQQLLKMLYPDLTIVARLCEAT